MSDCPYGQCDHSFAAHECGLCQVVTRDYPREHCPCGYQEADDE